MTQRRGSPATAASTTADTMFQTSTCPRSRLMPSRQKIDCLEAQPLILQQKTDITQPPRCLLPLHLLHHCHHEILSKRFLFSTAVLGQQSQILYPPTLLQRPLRLAALSTFMHKRAQRFGRLCPRNLRQKSQKACLPRLPRQLTELRGAGHDALGRGEVRQVEGVELFG